MRYLKLNQRILVYIAVVGLMAALTLPAVEAAVVPWSLEELTLRAGLIVRGRITRQFSTWNKAKTAIFTESTLEVLDQIKGWTDQDRLVIRTEGGVVDGVRETVSPEPRFVPGEEVLVFLEPSLAGSYRVTGSIQGKYTIQHGWALNDEMGMVVPLIFFVQRIRGIMDAHGTVSSLPVDWVSRFPPATTHPPGLTPLGFVYDGFHWPRPDTVVTYLVNVNTTDVPANQALQAIQAAADTWTNVVGADFTFTYGGKTTATDFDIGNGKNDIMWNDKGNVGYAARTQLRGSCLNADCLRVEIDEADMMINDYYQWDTSGSPDDGEVDLQSLVLHELGHMLRLGHDPDPDAVMYWRLEVPVKRTLHQNDIDGIRCIYASADFDGDGTVVVDEIAEVANRWRSEPADPGYEDRYDLNGDGIINIKDIAIAVLGMNNSCP